MQTLPGAALVLDAALNAPQDDPYYAYAAALSINDLARSGPTPSPTANGSPIHPRSKPARVGPGRHPADRHHHPGSSSLQ
jgi:hypothetical protein